VSLRFLQSGAVLALTCSQHKPRLHFSFLFFFLKKFRYSYYTQYFILIRSKRFSQENNAQPHHLVTYLKYLNFFNKTLSQSNDSNGDNKSVIRVKLRILFSETEKTKRQQLFSFSFLSLSLSKTQTHTDKRFVSLKQP
jgi:hypothetical protein